MRTSLIGFLCFTIVAPAVLTHAAAPSETRKLREEVRQLREERRRDQERIQQLEHRLDAVEAAGTQQEKKVETTVADEVRKQTADAPRRYMDRYWGENRFVLTGYGTATIEWHRNTSASTFTAGFAPILLYRATDRVLFEAEPEFELKDTGETDINLEYAQADILLTDYATLVAGKFLLPFGEFIQQLHPAWINKLVSFPLPYRENEEGGIMPFSDVGIQVRGGTRLLGREGVNLDYTVYASNGPRFDSEKLGAKFTANNVDGNRGKGFGARAALLWADPGSRLGSLKVGASTYDGKWNANNDRWFTSWGVDAVYRLDELELRGEYLRTRRELPMALGIDKRDGWYAQGAYRLSRVPVAHLNRMELIARWSGVNQRAVTDEELLPHAQQVALGVDYWLTPSIVGKLEYDRELPRHAAKDHAVRAQIAVGF